MIFVCASVYKTNTFYRGREGKGERIGRRENSYQFMF